jgi:hypothetical protein
VCGPKSGKTIWPSPRDQHRRDYIGASTLIDVGICAPSIACSGAEPYAARIRQIGNYK